MYKKPHNIHVKYTDTISDWPRNVPAAKRKDNFRHSNSHMELSLHLAMDWNEMNQQSIQGNLPDITLLLICHKLTTHRKEISHH